MKRVAARRARRHIAPPKKARQTPWQPQVAPEDHVRLEAIRKARRQRRALAAIKARSSAKDLIAHYMLQAYKGKQKAGQALAG